METFSQRLIKLRQDAGLSVKSLAILLNISEMGVQCLEEEYNPPTVPILIRLAEIFNVSLGYVAMFSNEAKVSEDPGVKEVFLLDHLHNATKDDILGSVFMNRDDMHGKDYYALRVKDDAMTKARMFKGDNLIVCRQSYASTGDIIVAVLPSGEEVVRRYARVGNTVTLTAESDNPKYRTVKIDTTESPFIVLGKVFEVRISVK